MPQHRIVGGLANTIVVVADASAHR
jgi:hypothetical protein